MLKNHFLRILILVIFPLLFDCYVLTAAILAPEPTSQPTNLTFLKVNGNAVQLRLTPAADNPTGYLIVRTSGQIATDPIDGIEYTRGQKPGTEYVVLSGDSLTFWDQGVWDGTYSYKIYSFNGNGANINYLTRSPYIERLDFGEGNYYSVGSGNWQDPNSWSHDGHEGTPGAGSPAGTGSEVFIGNGHEITMTQDVSISSKTLTIQPGASLNVNGYSLNVSGFLWNKGSIINGGELQTDLSAFRIYSYNEIPVFKNMVIHIQGGDVRLFTDVVLYNGYKITGGDGVMRTNGFKIYPCMPPTIRPSNVVVTKQNNQATVNWVRGNGDRALVVARVRGTTLKSPVPGKAYTSNLSFGLGSKTGTGNYVVYYGSGNSIIVTNLDPAQSYDFEVYESNSSGNCYNVSSPTLPITDVSSPANGSTGVYVDRKISTRLIGGDAGWLYQYTIELSLSEDFSSGVLSKTGTTPYEIFNGLQYNTKYYTRVKTNVSPMYSKVTSFTTGAPEEFTYMSSPQHLAINRPLSLNVSSKAVSGALLYTIELNTAPDFTGTSIVKTGARTQKFTGLLPLTTYYVRIKSDLSSIWGPSRNFTTMSASGARSVTEDSDDGEVESSESESIRVYPIPFTDDFTIQVNSEKDEEFEVTIFDAFGNAKVNKKGLTNEAVGLSGRTFSNGYYFVKVRTSKETYFRKIVKEGTL